MPNLYGDSVVRECVSAECSAVDGKAAVRIPTCYILNREAAFVRIVNLL
jgi:hypothetical protein